MLIAECVLVYIEPSLSSQLIKWAGKLFTTALFLNYEPVSVLLWVHWHFVYNNLYEIQWEIMLLAI